MDLKTFVAESLGQIVEWVQDAKARAKKVKAHVNPPTYSAIGDVLFGEQWVNPKRDKPWTFPEGLTPEQLAMEGVTKVSFDVALTVETGKEGEGRLSVVGGAVGLGLLAKFGMGTEARGKAEKRSSKVHRVQFEIPVQLPME